MSNHLSGNASDGACGDLEHADGCEPEILQHTEFWLND